MPLVSVIMPVHQVTPFLRPAVESMLQQTLTDFELLWVDNGTGVGLAPLGPVGRDSRIRLFSLPENRGIAEAQQLAYAHARGEFVALMDSDDVSLPERLARQVAALQARPRLGLIFARTLVMDAGGKIEGPLFTLQGERQHFVFSAYSTPAATPTLLARREVFERVPIRTEFRMAPDLDFLARAVELWPSDALADVLFHYRRHDGQTTARAYRQQQYEVCMTRLLTARRRAGQVEDLPGLTGECRALWPDAPPTLVQSYVWFAERAQQEGFTLLAVYFARKLLSVRRDLPALRAALNVTGRALRHRGVSRTQLLRMFLTGPLRTHGLKPL